MSMRSAHQLKNMRIEEIFQETDRLVLTGNATEAEQLLLQEIANLEQQGLIPSLAFAQLSNELAGLYRSNSRYSEAQRYFLAALCALEACGRKESADYASAEMNYAGALRQMGDLRQAKERFLSAKGRMERLSLTNSYVYHSILNNLALVYQQQGCLQEANQLLTHSLEWNRSQPNNNHEIATALNNLALIRQKMGDIPGARTLIEEALQMYDRMPPNVHHAAALEMRAALLVDQRYYEQALSDFCRAREKTLFFFGKNAEYAIACQNIALVLCRLKRWKEAIRYQEESLTVRRQITSADHPATVRAEQLLLRMQQEQEGKKHGMSGAQ